MRDGKSQIREATSEKDFSRQVEDLLNLFSWRWCHFRPARTEHGWRTALSGYKGFPDYIAVKSSRLLIFELKSEKGKVSPTQQEWLDILTECQRMMIKEPLRVEQGVASIPMREAKFTSAPEVYLWRPSDFDEIAEILR